MAISGAGNALRERLERDGSMANENLDAWSSPGALGAIQGYVDRTLKK